MIPNLNNTKERLIYIIGGGKVRRKEIDGAYWYWCETTQSFAEFNGFKKACGISQYLFSSEYFDWLPYEEPKSERDKREEFAQEWKNIHQDIYNNQETRARRVTQLLFDTFALKEK